MGRVCTKQYHCPVHKEGSARVRNASWMPEEILVVLRLQNLAFYCRMAIHISMARNRWSMRKEKTHPYRNMRSLVLTLALVFAIACTSCSARKECACGGGLGPGSNPCGCDEIVVKAAKQWRPLHYVSPEAIAEAAISREIMAKYTTKPGPCGQSTSGINYVESSTTTAATAEEPRVVYELLRKSAALAPRIIGSESDVVVIADAGSSASSGSSGGCGCGGSSAQINAKSMPGASNLPARIVPKFPPIGDMCHTSSSSSGGSSQQQTGTTITKVTPAYPGKLKCSCDKGETGEVDCMSVLSSILNGGSVARSTALAAAKGARISGSSGAFGASSSGSGFASLTGEYGLKSSGFGASSSSSSSSGSSLSTLGVFGQSTNIVSQSSSSSSSGAVTGSKSGRVVLLSEEMGGPVVTYGSAPIVEVVETLEQQVVPHAPADPVSLSLAYKNLIPQQRQFVVSEDKLSFGPTAVPKEAVKQEQKNVIDEEKLVTIEKPVMQLQALPSKPAAEKTTSEEEEERFAEIDALERTRLEKQSTKVEQVPQSYVTYRELGYAPIQAYSNPAMVTVVSNVEEFSSGSSSGPEEPCGPMGPPKPDYVPGNVYVQQQAVESEAISDSSYRSCGEGERSVETVDVDDDDDDDAASEVDDSSPGFLARLSSASRNFGSLPCPM